MEPDSLGFTEGEGALRGSRRLILLFQFVVGSLVTFGGTAYVIFSVNAVGSAFGAGHLLAGLTGLSVGFFTLAKKDLPRDWLLGVNVVTIVYSLLSDGVAGVLSLLPAGAFRDSVIGTAIAVTISCAIVYLLQSRN